MVGRDNLNEGDLGESLTDGTNLGGSNPIYSIPKKEETFEEQK